MIYVARHDLTGLRLLYWESSSGGRAVLFKWENRGPIYYHSALQPASDRKGESCTYVLSDFCFRETSLERAHISLNLFKAPWPVLS